MVLEGTPTLRFGGNTWFVVFVVLAEKNSVCGFGENSFFAVLPIKNQFDDFEGKPIS